MSNVRLERIDVKPNELAILDVKQIDDMQTFIVLHPTYYRCRLLLSPLVIQRLIQWMVKKGYIVLEGSLTLRIRNVRITHNGTS